MGTVKTKRYLEVFGLALLLEQEAGGSGLSQDVHGGAGREGLTGTGHIAVRTTPGYVTGHDLHESSQHNTIQ